MMGEGTVNDEELVEVIARRFARIDRLWSVTANSCRESDPCYSCRHRANAAVAELRSAGFQVLPRLTALEEGQEELADWYAGGSG